MSTIWTSTKLLVTWAKLGFAMLILRDWKRVFLAREKHRGMTWCRRATVHFCSPQWQGGDGVIAATGKGQTWTQHLSQVTPKWQKAANLYLHSCGLVQPVNKTRGVLPSQVKLSPILSRSPACLTRVNSQVLGFSRWTAAADYLLDGSQEQPLILKSLSLFSKVVLPCKGISLRLESEDVPGGLGGSRHFVRLGQVLGSCTTSKNCLCISSKQCRLLKKKVSWHVQTSFSDAKRCANISRNKVILQSWFVPIQWIKPANQYHLKSLRHFIESSLPFRDRKKERRGKGGGRRGEENVFSASV